MFKLLVDAKIQILEANLYLFPNPVSEYLLG